MIVVLQAEESLRLVSITALGNGLVKKGDELLIELRSSINRKKVAGLAKIVWAENTGNDNMCGLEFLWLSSELSFNDWFKFAEELPALG